MNGCSVAKQIKEYDRELEKTTNQVILIIICFCLNLTFSNLVIAESELLEQTNLNLGEVINQTDTPAPYPGTTLTHIWHERGPQGQIASKLLEIDLNGNIVWNYTHKPNEEVHGTIFDAELLPNGHILLVVNFVENLTKWWGDNLHAQIIEITRKGDIVWQYDLYWQFFDNHQIHDVDKLENGNILIADTSQDRVIEVAMDHQIVWEWKAIDWFVPPEDWDPESPDINYNDWTHLNDADRLSDGHTLISLRNLYKVVEVNETGHIVWEWGNQTNLGHPHNPDKLLNGNVLICDSGYNRIIEVNTTTNEIVWMYEGTLSWPRDADRLPNGNTLIADSLNDRVIEITPEKEIVWEQTGLKRVYEADRLNTPPTISIDSPHNRTYSTVNPIEVALSCPDIDLSKIWFSIHDDTRNIWIDPTNVTWDGMIQKSLLPGSYTLFAYANDSADWSQGDDVHSMTSVATIAFTIVAHDITISGIGVQDIWDSPIHVEKGQYIPVQINVTNRGSVEEKIRVDLTIIERDQECGNQTNTPCNVSIGSQTLTLAAGAFQIVIIHWNTSEIPSDMYELTARVDSLPEEDNTRDNSASIFALVTLPPVRELPLITPSMNVLGIGIALLFIFWRSCTFGKRRKI